MSLMVLSNLIDEWIHSLGITKDTPTMTRGKSEVDLAAESTFLLHLMSVGLSIQQQK